MAIYPFNFLDRHRVRLTGAHRENSGSIRFSQNRRVDFGTSHFWLICWMAKFWGGAGFPGHEFTVKFHEQGGRGYGRRGIRTWDRSCPSGWRDNSRPVPGQRRSVARKREVFATALLRNWLLDIFMKMLQSLIIYL